MSKKLLFLVVALILLTPSLLAAENNAPRTTVYIRPWSGEMTIDLRNEVGVARVGWGNCSTGLAADWVENTVIHLELYEGATLVQTIDTGDASWVTTSDPAAPFASTCWHVGDPQASLWDYARLRLRRAGDYTLYFTVETTVPMTDGSDFDADGVMDLHPAQLWFDAEPVLIHVVR